MIKTMTLEELDEMEFPPWNAAPCTREQTKVLMALGAAKSSVHIRQIAARTGIKTVDVLTICKWGVSLRIVQQLADSNEFFAASDIVVNYFINGNAG